MSSNIQEFTLHMERYANEHVPGRIRDEVTLVALEGGRGLAETTPVDRGRAKGNWQVTVGGYAEGEIERLDPTPHGSSVASLLPADVLREMDEWRPGDFIGFHNGVPYIRVLNNGAPNRRAHHMLERTVGRLQRWLA